LHVASLVQGRWLLGIPRRSKHTFVRQRANEKRVAETKNRPRQRKVFFLFPVLFFLSFRVDIRVCFCDQLCLHIVERKKYKKKKPSRFCRRTFIQEGDHLIELTTVSLNPLLFPLTPLPFVLFPPQQEWRSFPVAQCSGRPLTTI